MDGATQGDVTPSGGLPAPGAPEVSAREFQESFGEDLRHTLDLETWHAGEDLAKTYGRLEAEVRDAVQQETKLRQHIREQLFPQIGRYPGAPKGAGMYQAEANHLQRIHRD